MPFVVMAHDYPAGVARQALGRFRGNARAAFEDRLPRLLPIGQHRGVDVDHHLVALPRRAGIEAVVQGRLREQGQRIRCCATVAVSAETSPNPVEALARSRLR
jgi:hypothetical protein